jgi:acetyl-CoA acetyltransferase
MSSDEDMIAGGALWGKEGSCSVDGWASSRAVLNRSVHNTAFGNHAARITASGEMKMGRKVYVVGVGMTKFEKPGSRAWDYPDMAKESGTNALQDAGISYDSVEQAVVGYCYGESTCGERALYGLGMTGIPIYNVNNNCSTGSTALFMAKQFIEGGIADCVMALGFEKMEKGSLGAKYTDRINPMDKHVQLMADLRGFAPSPPAAQMFGNAGREHMERYGTTALQFAKIGWKNHKHSVNNPYSQFQDEYSLEGNLSAPMVYEPLTKLQCCPTSDGSGAAILASADFVKKHGLENKAVEILGMAMATDFASTFSARSCIKMVGSDLSKAAAHKVYEQSGMGPENVDVIELHDCFSCNELITYEALGLCPEGKGGEFVDAGANTYGGKVVVNPSGGLISKGHPLGATGLAQCAELNWQLRGKADKRQVPGAKVALQHNLGLGGAAVVTMYRRANPS